MEQIAASGGRLDVAMTLRDESARGKSGRVFLDEHCAAHAIPLVKIGNVNDPEAIAAIREFDLDWLFIIGWSQIARRPVLEATRCGTLGMHPTLLPEGRGRAAIPWAIIKGLTVTGVTLFKLDEGVDTGPIAEQVRVPVDPTETATSLYEKLDAAHCRLMAQCWSKLVAGTLSLRAQDETRASVWPGRRPEDGCLDLTMDVAAAERLVRAVTRPYPGAFLDHDGWRIRIWNAIVRSMTSAPAKLDLSATRPLIPFSDGVLELLEWETQAIE
jgi:methionyl-tRNA formyltransferase